MEDRLQTTRVNPLWAMKPCVVHLDFKSHLAKLITLEGPRVLRFKVYSTSNWLSHINIGHGYHFVTKSK